MKILFTKLLGIVISVGVVSLVFFTMPANPVVETGKACASQWGPNCPGVWENHDRCPSGAAYPASYPACIDSVDLTVHVVVRGLTGNNGSIKIKAHAKGAGSPGWEDACVTNEVRCLLREADSVEETVSSDGTSNFYIDVLGCTSGKCNDNFSITAQFNTNGTQYTCERTDDQTTNLNRNGQPVEATVGVKCTLPAVTVCNRYCDTTSGKTCEAGGKTYNPTTEKCTTNGVDSYNPLTCGTPGDSGSCEIPPTPVPTKIPTPIPTKIPTPIPSKIPTPTTFCPVPPTVTNVHIDCPTCSN